MHAQATRPQRRNAYRMSVAALLAVALALLWLRPEPDRSQALQEEPSLSSPAAIAQDPAEDQAGPAAAAPAPARVAVFPFTASPADPAAEPLRIGLAEILIQRLGSSGEAEAVGRQSILAANLLGLDRTQAAALLDAAYVLDGRFELVGERLQLEAEFHDIRAGTRLWVHRDAGELELLQRLPDRLERRVRASLRASAGLYEVEVDAEAASPEVPVEAHLAYLKGRFASQRRTAQGLQRGLDWFERAVLLAPDYAPAWTGIAENRQLLVWYAGEWPNAMYPQALEAVERALALDPGAADAAATAGLILWTYRRDLAAAERALQGALAANPDSAEALHALGQLLALTGRHDEAVDLFQRALQIEPLSLVIRTDYGSTWLWNGDPATALEHYLYVLQLDPDFALAQLFAGLALVAMGQHEEASARLERAALLGGSPPLWRATLARNHAAAGRTAEARAMLEQLDAERSFRFVSPVALALVHLALEDRSSALAEIQRGLDEHDPMLIYLLAYPEFRALRGDPEFDALVADSRLEADRPGVLD
jgi:tetratricopeptide (TPR) repeat protein